MFPRFFAGEGVRVKGGMRRIVSGGITEETTVLGKPCLTLRDNTERPETITIGTDELIGTDPSKLPPALARLMAGQWKQGAIPLKWDGKAAERVVEHLEQLLINR